MGDSGSQVIGFSLGLLAVPPIERVDPSLSPAAAVSSSACDSHILYVLYRRIQQHGNWFRATKNHVHHRLMERLFYASGSRGHQRHSDFLRSERSRAAPCKRLVACGSFGCTVVFGGLYLAERFEWYAPRRGQERGMWRWLGRGTRRKFLLVEPPSPGSGDRCSRLSAGGEPSGQRGAACGWLPAIGSMGRPAIFELGWVKTRALNSSRCDLCVLGLVVYLALGYGADSVGWRQTAAQIYFAVVA